MRWLALVAGVALIALAIGAGTRVADTREGLVAEIVTLLGALAGIALLIYGLTARPRPQVAVPARPGPTIATARGRSSRDLVLGAAGIALALVLLGGLAISGGLLWAAFGLALLLPMLAGCVYLCLRYLRARPPDKGESRISPTR
jgi:hypothetical protein